MELAGLNIVMDADFSAVFSGMAQANTMFQSFAQNIKNAFNDIPNFKNKFNFTSNGASQAAQDAREYARAAKEQAEADLAAARAKDIADRATERQNKTNKQAKDLYGQLVAENQALVREYYNAAAAIIKQGDAAGISAERLEEMRQAALAGQQQLQEIEQGVGRFQRNVGNYGSAFNPLRNSINQISRELPAFTNSLQTGFMAISNNLPALADAINQIRESNAALVAQGQPTQSMFKQLLGAIISWQTALSVGITLLTVYGKDIVEFATELFRGRQALDKVKESQEAYNEAVKNTEFKNAIENVEELTQKIRLAKDGFIDKKAVVKEYNDTIGRTTGFVNNINQAEQQLIKNKDAYLQMMLQKAAANVLLQKAAELQADAMVKQAKKEELGIWDRIKAYRENLTAAQKLQQILAIGSPTPFARTKAENEALKKYSEERIADTKKEASAYEDLAKSLFGSSATIAKSMGFSFDPVDKPGKDKDVRTATDALDELLKKNQMVDRELELGLTTFQNSLKEKAKNWESYIRDISGRKLKVGIDDPQIQKALGSLTEINEQLALTEDLSKKLNIAPVQKLAVEVAKVGPAAELSWERWRKAIDQGFIEQKIKVVAERMKEMTDAIQRQIAGTMVQTAEMIGTGIGNIISGASGLDGLFKGLGQLLGDQIIALGKELIKAGGLMEAIQAAIAALNIQPGIAIAVGFAAVAFGAGLKAALGKQSAGVGRRAFATGGVVYGPTNALVGEYAGARGNPEVIAPLDKLQAILKRDGIGQGGTQVFIPNVTLKGQDIVIAFERTKRSNNR